MSIMGRPQDFTDEASTDESKNSSKGYRKIKTGKKLFRDTDNQMVGGVAAGLAAYFGISDPLIVRIIFILCSVLGGSGLIAYLIFLDCRTKS